ncbi:MAG: SUMF1/EgtB/PvdO family nonheme iron enzyme [Chloroflexi bacterium]|nr:SUMF1/EgtB/PvdO family nonheme iron enzyme [Chloroflexota bacterium]MCC6892473.1 SUMF1/EgtB/PvdO family nonheme iron enzyme [Anaerolineae bacterium]
MSKLFISYSRDDKAWVYELWRGLRDRAHHDAWIDQRLMPAQDWWEGILQNIETCECFIYIMSPKCVESIYCTAELNYALALNKPIVPLMLKQCDTPQSLKSRRIQYAIVRDDMSLGDTLFTVERALGDVRVNIFQGKYPPPSPLPDRPDEPKPESKPEQISEVYMLAEEAAAENNISLALKLFQQVKEADPSGWGLAAAERVGEIQHENSRNKEYQTIVQMSANSTLYRGAKAAWRVYIQKYGVTYDPNNIAGLFVVPPPTVPPTVGTAYMPSAAPSRPTSLSLMPQPFAWIDIPAGKVTLGGNDDANGGYIKIATTFEVAAFQIGKYPITNAQFAKFVEAKGYEQEKWWTADGWEMRQENEWSEPRYWWDDKWNKPNYPVVGVSWYESVAFCQWLGETSGENIMLPTEDQWQRAAQGDDGRDYPWGKQGDASRCNNNVYGKGIGKTTPVRQYEGKGDSPFGVVDMSGNVWEWCLTQYEANNNLLDGTDVRVLRGGAWYVNNADFFRCEYRNGGNPHGRSNDVGFRISRFK